MMNIYGVRSGLLRSGGAVALAVLMMAGCSSKQDQAIEQAKKQAVATGQPQQVTTVDKNGTTIVTTVQPPPQGQATPTVTTTTAPTQTVPGTPPPSPGTYYQPIGTASGQASGPAGSAPPPAPAPVVQPADVRIPAGSTLSIRINQRISVKTTPAGSRFDGEVAEGWQDDNGHVILPKGTPVEGVVDASHRRGHFKGASILELRLTSLSLNGQRYPIATHDLTRTKKGKGKRSAAMIGGGAGLGMLIGGIASGGTGLLIGGLAGGGAGTAAAGLTGNRDLDIPAESIVRFKLADDLTLQGN